MCGKTVFFHTAMKNCVVRGDVVSSHAHVIYTVTTERLLSTVAVLLLLRGLLCQSVQLRHSHTQTNDYEDLETNNKQKQKSYSKLQQSLIRILLS